VGKKIFSYLFFAIIIALIVGGLKLVNWLPLRLQPETLQRYERLDMVRAALKIDKVYTPSYFPQRLAWPPSDILAQKVPFAVIHMEFRDKDTDERLLIISQVDAEVRYLPSHPIKIEKVTERIPYSLKGREAVMVVGACRDGETCSEVSWTEGDYRLLVSMRSSPIDLIKIADSMIR
jgi:hypothetical protein